MTNPASPDAPDLEAVRKRAEAATSVPWEVQTPMGDETPWIVEAGKESYEWRCIAMTTSGSDEVDDDDFTTLEAARNAAFIAHARADIPALLDLIQHDRERIAALEAALKPFAEILLVRDHPGHSKDGDMIDAPDLAITPRQIRAARATLGAKGE